MIAFEQNRKVHLRPVDKRPVIQYQRVVDRDESQNDIVVPENELTRAPGTKYSIMAPPSAKLGGFLATGLHHMVANPYKDETTYRDAKWEEIFKGKEEVLLQHILEYKFHKPFNYYTNQIPLKRVPNIGDKDQVDKNQYFFQSEEGVFNLEDSTMILDLNNERHLVLYYLCLEDPEIASSYNEIKPFTRYYISGETEEVERKAKSGKKVDLAVSKLIEIESEADTALMQAFGNVCGVRTKGMSAEAIYSELSRNLKSNKDGFIDNFNYYYKLYKEPATADKFFAVSEVVDLLAYGVIVERGGNFTWQPPADKDGRARNEVSWYRRDSLIDSLEDKQHQEERMEMLEQLKIKRMYQ